MIDTSKARGVIFDLDGTLVSSTLDFSTIRQEIGCPENVDLLSFIDSMELEASRNEAAQIVLRHELEDAYESSWLLGAKEFVFELAAANMPMAIVTRNCSQASAIKIKNNQVPIELVLTREDAPAKPKPDALILVAEQWQISPSDLLYVGDYIYDELAAENAGMPFSYSPFG